MRQSILLFTLICASLFASAQTTVHGHYLSKNNDTITAQIKIPKSIFGSADLSKLFFKVEISDSLNESNEFKPDDINGFGFTYENKTYNFVSKPTIIKKNLRFVQPVIIGNKTSLYQFETVDQNGRKIGTFYTFEKADGSYTFLNTGIKNLNTFKETLKAFYSDDSEVQKLIEKKFKSRMSIHSDIKEIVAAVNQ